MSEWVILKLKSRCVPLSWMSERGVRDVKVGGAEQDKSADNTPTMHHIMGLAASVLILPVV
jgi:hypothetical protein